jgi:hypothetical protein
MRLYDERGEVVDFGTLSVDDLNGIVREAVDMMRRQAKDRVVRRELEDLNKAAVRFTNMYYRGRTGLPLGWESINPVE